MKPRRLWLRVLAATGLFGSAGISGLIRNVEAKGNVPVAPGLHKLRGEVKVNSTPARQGQLIGAGDTVVTGRDSEAIYVMGRDAFLQRENSTISFGADVTKHVLRVVTGKLLSVFGKRTRTIQVSTAVIGIRGTGCYIEDEGTGTNARTYFCLCYGSVDLTPSAAPRERKSYSTTHHEKPIYIYNDMKMAKMIVPASVINHTDEELEMLESLVGRRPPFYGRGGSKY